MIEGGSVVLAYSHCAGLETILGHSLELLTWVRPGFDMRATYPTALNLRISHSSQHFFLTI